MFTIIFYPLEDGTNAIDPWLDTLSIKMQAKVLRSIQLLQVFGPLLREPNSKPLEDGIFELRTVLGNDIERTLYFFQEGQNIVLTNGFTKKTNKTPRAEIDLAKARREDYKRRFPNG